MQVVGAGDVGRQAALMRQVRADAAEAVVAAREDRTHAATDLRRKDQAREAQAAEAVERQRSNEAFASDRTERQRDVEAPKQPPAAAALHIESPAPLHEVQKRPSVAEIANRVPDEASPPRTRDPVEPPVRPVERAFAEGRKALDVRSQWVLDKVA